MNTIQKEEKLKQALNKLRGTPRFIAEEFTLSASIVSGIGIRGLFEWKAVCKTSDKNVFEMIENTTQIEVEVPGYYSNLKGYITAAYYIPQSKKIKIEIRGRI